jgi:hypothetical protein
MFKGKSKPTLFACFDPTSVAIPPQLADLYAVPADIIAFWVAVQPAMEKALTRILRPPGPPAPTHRRF